MKRVGNLLERIADAENLREAFISASRAKASRPDVVEYRENLAVNLEMLRGQLLSQSVPMGGYRQFQVYDPKERTITVAPFCQRVLHHAIMRVCEPFFENHLVPRTYACRKGKGRLAALDEAAKHSRKFTWYLKLDIRKYFGSVPHDRLVARLGRIFKDAGLVALLEGIIRSFEVTPGRGLPIGNLTSQHFANLYLDKLDRFIEGYLPKGRLVSLRYMDDLVVFGAQRVDLVELRLALREYLPTELGLTLKQERIGPVSHGIPFLGCTVFRDHRELNRRSRLRFAKRIANLDRCLAANMITEIQAQRRATAMAAYAKTASSLRFRQHVLIQHFRASAIGWAEPPTAGSVVVAGTTTPRTAPSPTATTTTTRTTETTTTDSVRPAAREHFPDGKASPEPAAVLICESADKAPKQPLLVSSLGNPSVEREGGIGSLPSPYPCIF
jgi:hypothetical protein